MIRLSRLAVPLAALALVACSSTPEKPFVKTGEFVYTRGTSASFSDDRVVGSGVAFNKRDDGSWGGTIGTQLYNLNVTDNRMSGVNFNFTWQNVDQGFSGQGLIQGDMVKIEVTAQQILVRNGRKQLALGRTDETTFGTGNNRIVLEGAALQLPMPQTVLSLLALVSN